MSWSYIASAFGGTTGSSQTSVTAAPSGDPTHGQLYLATCTAISPGTLAVSDSNSNTWNSLGVITGPSSIAINVWWSAVTTAVTPSTVQVTSTVACEMALNVDVFSVAPGASITIGTASNDNNNTTSLDAGTTSYSGAGNWLLYGAFAAKTATSWSGGSGTTLASQIASAGNYPGLLTEYLTTTASSSPQILAATIAAVQPRWAAYGVPFLESTSTTYPLRAWVQLRAPRGMRLSPPNPAG